MFDYIIVQAGGKGTRMKHLTANKPKALVPIDNLPMLFHLFRKYPDKRFIIIGDYKCDVLKKYLSVFAKVQYIVVDACGKSGTCAGLKHALQYVPDHSAFMLMWCDLVLPEAFTIPEKRANYIGISKGFSCRWSYKNGIFSETPSDENGVAGMFIFTDQRALDAVPEEGEFVRWLQSQSKRFETIGLYKTREFGLLEVYEKQAPIRCRPFNRITEMSGKLLKEGIDAQGQMLAQREKNWYKLAQKLGITAIPQVYSFEPFVMEKIDGKNIFEYQLAKEQRLQILHKLVKMLRDVHDADKTGIPVDYFSIRDAYVTKTFTRLNKIRDLVPFGGNEFICVNGRRCHNIFFFKDILSERFAQYRTRDFRFIHGDCTFSNLMLREGSEPVMIDPRGYFGFTENYGDTAYDWAKLYYSIAGNYDQFNLKRFSLAILEDGVELQIASNGWEDMRDEFFGLLKGEVDERDILLIHAVIWLSLTTYAWEDYDSICAAFYSGLYYLEEALWG
ncbi:hypothetical protein HMPREF0322_05153 [Desulfitobacterium hafniense DP7]|uniref:Nucleoside-diphosphate-sugar pyrophosphorylase n=1 Tax=Desulfitobacterium hafniense DP7 TaxID=537010 RepID=G9XVX0_DESHA|nr:phosphotransferase [Desulfitobacterium hafniense]EHL04233.1 hypothetical protein HMPREF0322_05153 [Desulfitobacterium hafniense DP7]